MVIELQHNAVKLDRKIDLDVIIITRHAACRIYRLGVWARFFMRIICTEIEDSWHGELWEIYHMIAHVVNCPSVPCPWWLVWVVPNLAIYCWQTCSRKMSSVISPWCTWACTWPPSWRQHMDKGSQVGSFGRCSITHNLAAMAAFLNCGGIDRYANRPFSRTMYWSPTLCFWYRPTLTHVHQIHHYFTILELNIQFLPLKE